MYLNREKKEETFIIAAIQSYLESKIPQWVTLGYPKEVLEQARRSNTHLSKLLIEILRQVDVTQKEKLLRDVLQYDVSVRTKTLAEVQKRQPDNALINAEQLYDYADLVVGANCRGCDGKEKCGIRGLLLATGIDPVDAENSVCVYQIK